MAIHLIDWPNAALRAGAAHIPCGLRLRATSRATVPRVVEMLAGGPDAPLLNYDDVEIVLDLDAQEVSISTRSVQVGSGRPHLTQPQRHAVEVAMLGGRGA